MALTVGKSTFKMESLTPYVMFGVHPLFGDYVDAIHACGGYLARVVMNVPEPERPPGERFVDKRDMYHDWLARNGSSHRVDVIWLDHYKPCSEETPILGFRGTKVLPLVDRLKEEFNLVFPPLVHPKASVSPMADLEEGVFIGAGSIIPPNTRVGSFSLVNRGVTLGHDVTVERCVVVSPSACTASDVRLCEGSVVGIGATIVDDVTIGSGAYVAGGAVVLKDVLPETLVAGVPAVVKKVFNGAKA